MNLTTMNHIEDELTCCVCLDLFESPVTLPCSHNLCKKCAQGLIENRNFRCQSFDCPKCRYQVTFNLGEGLDSLPENKALRNIVRIVKKERSVLINVSQCSKHKIDRHSYCQTCKTAICDKCKLESHTGFGHNVEVIDVVLAEKQDKADSCLMELKAIEKSLTDQQKQIADKKEKLKTYMDGLLESVDFSFGQLLHQTSIVKKTLVSSLEASLSNKKRTIEDEELCCRKKLAHIKSLIKQYKASQSSSLEPEYKLKVLDSYLLKQCSFMTFELNNHKYDVSQEPLPEVKLQGIEAVLKALEKVQWKCDEEEVTENMSNMCSNDKCQSDVKAGCIHDEKNDNTTKDTFVSSGNIHMPSPNNSEGVPSLIPNTKIVQKLGKFFGNLCLKGTSEIGHKLDQVSLPSFRGGDICGDTTVQPSTSDMNGNSSQAQVNSVDVTDADDQTLDSTEDDHKLLDHAVPPHQVIDYFKSFSDPGTSSASLKQHVQTSAQESSEIQGTVPADCMEGTSRNSTILHSSFSVDAPSSRPLFTLGSSPPTQRIRRKFRPMLPRKH